MFACHSIGQCYADCRSLNKLSLHSCGSRCTVVLLAQSYLLSMPLFINSDVARISESQTFVDHRQNLCHAIENELSGMAFSQVTKNLSL